MKKKAATILCDWMSGSNNISENIYGKDYNIGKINGRTDMGDLLLMRYQNSKSNLKKPKDRNGFIKAMTSHFLKKGKIHVDYHVNTELRELCVKYGFHPKDIPLKCVIRIDDNQITTWKNRIWKTIECKNGKWNLVDK